MNGKTKLLVAGLSALLVLGLVVAVNAAAGGLGQKGRGGFFRHGFGIRDGCGGNKTAFLADLELPENATREQVMDAGWAKMLSDLGLTEDSTVGEYHAAIKARMRENHGQMLQQMREKLGLPENATEEEVQDAMKQWREENRGLFPGKGRGQIRGNGFRAGSCTGMD